MWASIHGRQANARYYPRGSREQGVWGLSILFNFPADPYCWKIKSLHKGGQEGGLG